METKFATLLNVRN